MKHGKPTWNLIMLHHRSTIAYTNKVTPTTILCRFCAAVKRWLRNAYLEFQSILVAMLSDVCRYVWICILARDDVSWLHFSSACLGLARKAVPARNVRVFPSSLDYTVQSVSRMVILIKVSHQTLIVSKIILLDDSLDQSTSFRMTNNTSSSRCSCSC